MKFIKVFAFFVIAFSLGFTAKSILENNKQKKSKKVTGIGGIFF